MKNLNIQSTKNTPEIKFDVDSGKFLFRGRAIPEDPKKFFDRILEWLKKYYKENDKETEIEFMLEYANSGSSKCILEILKDISEYKDRKSIKVIWCYEEDDESIKELGELFDAAVNLPFEMKGVEMEE